MASPDLSTLTGAINFGSISDALLVVARQHVGMIVMLVGCYAVLGFIKLNTELNEERAKSARVDKDGNYVAAAKKNMAGGLVADDGALDAAIEADGESGGREHFQSWDDEDEENWDSLQD